MVYETKCLTKTVYQIYITISDKSEVMEGAKTKIAPVFTMQKNI